MATSFFKKLLAAVWAVLCASALWGIDPAINSIDIKVDLSRNGTAHIVEVWDVVVASGTEWYLVRENLGDIKISNLAVKNEEGLEYLNLGSWDVDKSLEQKAGKCGLHSTSNGYEICWGVGSYGPHKFTVSYDMSNVVKTLNDYDMLHMQFIGDELSSRPQQASLTLTAPEPLGEDNSLIWAFGFDGEINWQKDGSVLAKSNSELGYTDSMILLLRFDKGIFESESKQDRDFSAVLDKALDGSYYPEDPEPWYYALLGFILFGGMFWLFVIKPIKALTAALGFSKKKDRKRVKDIFGVKHLPRSINWSRDLPFNGDVFETYYIASHTSGVDDRSYSVVSSMLLKMMLNKVIEMRPDAKGRNEFYFNGNASVDYMDTAERHLLEILRTASGSDGILQEQEFKRWADSHPSQVKAFVNAIHRQVVDNFSADHMIGGRSSYENLQLNDSGRQAALKALEFKQFLKDFTLVSERYAVEVALWENYLVMAAVFGLASKVAKQMNAMAPNFKSFITVPISQFSNLVVFSDSLSRVTRSAYIRAITPVSTGSSYSGGSSSSSRGYGGHSSHSGGGGFSGGGHGGGSR